MTPQWVRCQASCPRDPAGTNEISRQIQPHLCSWHGKAVAVAQATRQAAAESVPSCVRMPTWTKFGYLYLGTVTLSYVCAVWHLSGDQSVVIGSDVKLTCVVRNLNVPVVWVKLPYSIISPDDEINSKDSRIYVVKGRIRNSYILNIRNVSWTDAGTYQCSQTLPEGQMIALSSRLNIMCKTSPENEIFEPLLVFPHEQYELVASQGNDVQLFCNDSKHPGAKVLWRKYDHSTADVQKELFFPGRYLNICDVQRWDRGTYSCEIVDKVGRKVRREVNLVVEYAPAITVPKPKVKQAVNHSSELQCFVEGVPLPNISWKRNHSELMNDTHYSIAAFVLENNMVSSTLTITDTEVGDFGNYTCHASNKLGFSSSRLRLIETSQPLSPTTHPDQQPSVETDAYNHMPRLNLTGFILGMMPPLCISFYIILHLGFRSRYAEERPEEEGGDGLDEIVWEQGLKH